jgi:hypothetical protein
MQFFSWLFMTRSLAKVGHGHSSRQPLLSFLCICTSISQQRFDDFDDLGAHLFRPNISAQVRRSQLQAAVIPCIQGFPYSGFDKLCLLLLTERVTQKHSGTKYSANGVGDTLARDVGCRAVDGLIEAGGGLE